MERLERLAARGAAIAFALTLLTFPGLAADAAPAAGGASLILQLPPSMSAEEVKAIPAELVARGARAAPPTIESAPATATGAQERSWTSGDLVALVNQRGAAAVAAIPGLAA